MKLLVDNALSHHLARLLSHDTPAIPEAQADLVLKILAQTKADLERGCIVSASRNHVRVRSLPLR